MPVYSLTSKKKIKDADKLKLANLFTDTHCGLTGAPEQFVHVLFSDGIPLFKGKTLYIHANIRHGRTPEKIQELKDTLVNKSAEILNVEAKKVHINLLEIHANWVMEGGFVMPKPGEEDEWMEKVTHALAEREIL